MSNTDQYDKGPEVTTAFNRWAIPVKWGILAGLFSVILTTVNFMFIIGNYPFFLATSFVIYVVVILFYFFAGVQQRRAFGGYISLKEAFRTIFIVILISGLISTVYGILYVKLIDPGVMDTIKESTMAFLERVGTPPEKIDETVEAFDREAARGMQPARLLYAFAQQIIVQSIFGFICAFIVKRKRPVFPV